MRALLEAGARVNVLDVDGYTPLHEARSVGVVKMLLDAGADPHMRGGIIGVSALEHHRGNNDLYPLLKGGGS